MRLGKDVLLEIVALFLDGLSKNEDISEKLRKLDLDVDPDDKEVLGLSVKYLNANPRAGEWDQN